MVYSKYSMRCISYISYGTDRDNIHITVIFSVDKQFSINIDREVVSDHVIN